jgi:5-methyltetrahydrofolate--homocysteine methyltransferase
VGFREPGSSYLEAINDRVVIFDGAIGTAIQRYQLSPDDFGGPSLEGCPEILCVSRPDVVAEVHDAFLATGCDVIETNTFGVLPSVLDEYGIGDRSEELAERAARIAREVADGYGAWVCGSLGPGTKLSTLGNISFGTQRDGYEVAARGLLRGGVDLLIIETVQDMLQAKAAVIAARRAMATVGRTVPLQVQVNVETTGTLLLGTEITSALTTILALNVDVIGMNCGTGPVEMGEHLRFLSERCPVPISCMPNAGLPAVVKGEMSYDVSPQQLAEHHARFVTDYGVSVVGGCCGTTPEHISAVVQACRDLTPAPRTPVVDPGLSSLYAHVPYDQAPAFLAIGERANANGFKRFQRALVDRDWDTCVAVCRDQVKEGAHAIDLNVDYTGEDGRVAMREIMSRAATQVTLPFVLDSTEPEVLEAGLEHLGAKPILNSVNLEDGDAAGTRFDRILKLAGTYGAAVICTCITEKGQARTGADKLAAALAIHERALRYGVASEDMFFDPLALTVATGLEESRRDAIETIEGIRLIREHLPACHLTLGISNVSFGLAPAARAAVNSVFLHECQQAGLDSAIVHAGRVLPLHRIEERVVEVCLDLIYDRRKPGYDPLQELMSIFAGVAEQATDREDRSDWPIDRRLEQRIIDGDRDGLGEDLDRALETRSALDIVNDILLGGMKVVGELFGSGKMQLPFVLQAAETMKAAVAYLEPHMDRAEGEPTGKGRIVIATVKGDVHDIGKNLVDIILTNNGYEVYNLGIKIQISDMINKAVEVGADAIGMSGLLVKSTLIMRDNLVELNDRGLSRIPVLLGGAALTRTFVERDLREIYEGRVFYGKDAFEGLRVMDRLVELKKSGAEDPEFGRAPGGRNLPPRMPKPAPDRSQLARRSPAVATDNKVFAPPFLGSRVVTGLPLDDIVPWLNEMPALYRTQWGFRPESGETDADFRERLRPLLREQLAAARTTGALQPKVAYGYYPANAEGDDLVLWCSEDRDRELARLSFPRQAAEPWLCIADFFRPIESGEIDYAALSVVTMGSRATEIALELKEQNRYRDYLFLHGLSVEMTEALAEFWHHHIRSEWGFADEDGDRIGMLRRQTYRGGRYSWGYPACPDLEANAVVAELLNVERIGVEVSEGFQFHPEQTTSAIICHHPQAKYFVA